MEAQKTLDYRTFFKSVDVSQVLYVHNKSLDDFNTKTAEEVFDFARPYNPLSKREQDQDFYNNLYRRNEISRKVTELLGETKQQDPAQVAVGQEWYKYRHGLVPSTKNVRNIRYKKE